MNQGEHREYQLIRLWNNFVHKISLYTFIISNFVFLFFFFFYRVSELLDYTADELTGKNLYTLCHGEDANRLRKSHIDREYIFIDN